MQKHLRRHHVDSSDDPITKVYVIQHSDHETVDAEVAVGGNGVRQQDRDDVEVDMVAEVKVQKEQGLELEEEVSALGIKTSLWLQ